jgi:hypothetical protein
VHIVYDAGNDARRDRQRDLRGLGHRSRKWGEKKREKKHPEWLLLSPRKFEAFYIVYQKTLGVLVGAAGFTTQPMHESTWP